MAKSRKKRNQNNYRLVLAGLMAVLAAGAVFLIVRERTSKKQITGARSHQTLRRAPRLTRDQATDLFRLAIDQAGGEDVWVRVSPAGSMSVLLLPRSYVAVDKAISHTAQEHDLRVSQVSMSAQPARRRSLQVTAYSARNLVCRWTMREVTQIPRVAIVMDDLGQNILAARELLQIRSPLTFSVMPRLPYSRQTAEEAHRAGIEVMLHLPMQPFKDSAPDVSRHEIKVDMSARAVDQIIQADLASVPYVAGVNNHMGSRATSDPRLMGEVMAALGARHLFYIDSRTTARSVALEVARRFGLPAFYRSVFLDDTRTVPYTLAQLHSLCRVAEKQGAALAIGHPYPSTIAALRQFLPNLEREDIQIVPVARLLSLQEVARLAPPAPARKL